MPHYSLTPVPQGFRVCLDGRMIGGGGTGVASYARALADTHQGLTTAAFVLEETLIGGKMDGRKWRRRLRALWPGSVRARRTGEHLLGAFDVFRLAQVYFDIHRRPMTVRPPISGGIMHWTYPLPLRLAGWKNVYTVHDAIPLTAPELTSIDGKRHRRLLRSLAHSADALITVSDAARAEVIAALAIDPDRITNCSLAVTLSPAPPRPPAGLVPLGYFLTVGTVEPRKNIARLVAAHEASTTMLPLVIAGPAVPAGHDLERLIAGSPRVIRLPYVDAAAMPGLMAGARALIMPSLAEGFGLPVAEAMTLGTPVITSDRGALAETAGEAALLIDPEDTGAISEAIRLLSGSDDQHARLSCAGRLNARRFAPSVFMHRLQVLYGSLLPSPLPANTGLR